MEIVDRLKKEIAAFLAMPKDTGQIRRSGGLTVHGGLADGIRHVHRRADIGSRRGRRQVRGMSRSRPGIIGELPTASRSEWRVCVADLIESLRLSRSQRKHFAAFAAPQFLAAIGPTTDITGLYPVVAP